MLNKVVSSKKQKRTNFTLKIIACENEHSA